MPGPRRVATHVRVTITDNHFGTANGGNHAGVGELRFAGQPAIVVTTLNNSGPGSLRAAIATGGVTVDATSLSSGLTLTDTGTPASGYRCFYVFAGSSLTLRGLTLSGFTAPSGSSAGAIFNNGTLTLAQCSLSGNSTTSDWSGGNGPTWVAGAILNYNGTLTLTQCSLTGKTAAAGGGAIFHLSGSQPLTQCTLSGNSSDYGGAISNRGVSTLDRCTLSGNSATRNGGASLETRETLMTQCTLTGNTAGEYGGAIYVEGEVTLRHCTVAGNSVGNSTGGGGVYVDSSRRLDLQNSIVAGNTFTGGNGSDVNNRGIVIASDANLVQAAVFTEVSGTVNGAGTITVANPRLAPLGNYSGPTLTMALLPDSPARNTATVLSPALTSDQRGFPIVGAPDIGAYEAGTLANYNDPEHPIALAAVNNLAIIYREAGRKDEALKLLEEGLPLEQKVNGPEHENTLGAMTDLAASYAQSGRLPEAIKLQEESLAIKRRVLRPSHPFFASALQNMAMMYEMAGRNDEAAKLRAELEALPAPDWAPARE
ncbi:MAG: tetratricopeptide repeat protein [Verrucomicrobiales bacterium]